MEVSGQILDKVSQIVGNYHQSSGWPIPSSSPTISSALLLLIETVNGPSVTRTSYTGLYRDNDALAQ